MGDNEQNYSDDEFPEEKSPPKPSALACEDAATHYDNEYAEEEDDTALVDGDDYEDDTLAASASVPVIDIPKETGEDLYDVNDFATPASPVNAGNEMSYDDNDFAQSVELPTTSPPILAAPTLAPAIEDSYNDNDFVDLKPSTAGGDGETEATTDSKKDNDIAADTTSSLIPVPEVSVEPSIDASTVEDSVSEAKDTSSMALAAESEVTDVKPSEEADVKPPTPADSLQIEPSAAKDAELESLQINTFNGQQEETALDGAPPADSADIEPSQQEITTTEAEVHETPAPQPSEPDIVPIPTEETAAAPSRSATPTADKPVAEEVKSISEAEEAKTDLQEASAVPDNEGKQEVVETPKEEAKEMSEQAESEANRADEKELLDNANVLIAQDKEQEPVEVSPTTVDEERSEEKVNVETEVSGLNLEPSDETKTASALEESPSQASEVPIEEPPVVRTPTPGQEVKMNQDAPLTTSTPPPEPQSKPTKGNNEAHQNENGEQSIPVQEIAPEVSSATTNTPQKPQSVQDVRKHDEPPIQRSFFDDSAYLGFETNDDEPVAYPKATEADLERLGKDNTHIRGVSGSIDLTDSVQEASNSSGAIQSADSPQASPDSVQTASPEAPLELPRKESKVKKRLPPRQQSTPQVQPQQQPQPQPPKPRPPQQPKRPKPPPSEEVKPVIDPESIAANLSLDQTCTMAFHSPQKDYRPWRQEPKPNGSPRKASPTKKKKVAVEPLSPPKYHFDPKIDKMKEEWLLLNMFRQGDSSKYESFCAIHKPVVNRPSSADRCNYQSRSRRLVNPKKKQEIQAMQERERNWVDGSSKNSIPPYDSILDKYCHTITSPLVQKQIYNSVNLSPQLAYVLEKRVQAQRQAELAFMAQEHAYAKSHRPKAETRPMPTPKSARKAEKPLQSDIVSIKWSTAKLKSDTID